MVTPDIFGQMKQALNRMRCGVGWHRWAGGVGTRRQERSYAYIAEG